MYSNSKLNKRAYSLVLALLLVLSMVLVPGVFPVSVFAEGEESMAPEANEQAIYVDGVGGSEADGSADHPYASVSEACAQINHDHEQDKTYIVICGKVTADGTTDSNNYKYFSKHIGEVVFTSNYGGVNYYAKGATFAFTGTWILLGNTTFENIYIVGRPYTLYANYYKLHLGKGVKVRNLAPPYENENTLANILYLGSNATIYKTYNIVPKDVVFTMESGAIYVLHGTGSGSQGSYDLNIKRPNVTLNIAGGNVPTLDLANSSSQQIGNVNVNIGGEATVGTIVRTNTAQIKGTVTCTLDLNGRALTMDVGADVEISLVDSQVRQNRETGAVTGGTFQNTGVGSVSNKAIWDPANEMYFLAIPNEGGTYGAYPFNMTVSALGINTIAKNPDNSAETEAVVCLRADFIALNPVKEKISDHGYIINGDKVSAKADYEFDSNIITTYGDLLRSFRTENINTETTAQVYVTVDGVDYVSTTQVEFTPAEIVKGIYEDQMDSITNQRHKDLINSLMEIVNGEG